ncbi:MAG: alpha/beta hydrolase [Pseudomonadota bacterium]
MIQQHKPIHYQIFGEDSSPKLVFLHGIMGQGRNWMSIAKRFSRSYQCLIYDQRGHGKSFHPEKGFELDDYVHDLSALLKELGWVGAVHLVGHSMGGRVALKFAHLYPDQVRQLVIVDIGPTSDWNSMSSILEKLDFVPTPFADRATARQFMESQFLEKYQNPMLMEFFYSNLVEKESGYDWIFSVELIRQTLTLARYHDYWDLFKELKMPTLLLRGEKSTDLKKDDFLAVVANNSQIQGREVIGAGHWVMRRSREKLSISLRIFSTLPGPPSNDRTGK